VIRNLFLIVAFLSISVYSAAQMISHQQGNTNSGTEVYCANTQDVLENDLVIIEAKWEDGARNCTVRDAAGVMTFTMQDSISNNNESCSRIGYHVISAAEAGTGKRFGATFGATTATVVVHAYVVRFGAGAPTFSGYAAASGNSTAPSSGTISPTGTEIFVTGFSACYNGSISAPLIGGSSPTASYNVAAYDLTYYTAYTSSQTNIASSATCASGSWTQSIIAFSTGGGGCTNPTSGAPSNFTDTVPNTRKMVFAVSAGSRDSLVSKADYTGDSLASKSVDDTIRCHFLKKMDASYKVYYSYGCDGTNADSDSVQITVIGPSVSYSAWTCSLNVAAIAKDVASTAMADSFTAKSTLPAWVTLTKSGANIGRLTGTPDEILTATDYWIYVWRKGVKADSGTVNISVIDTSCASTVTLTKPANTSVQVGQIVKRAFGGGTFDSLWITAKNPNVDTIAVPVKEQDTVRYRVMAKTASAIYVSLSKKNVCKLATIVDTITSVTGGSVAYSGFPAIDTTDKAIATKSITSMANLDSVLFSGMPPGVTGNKSTGDMTGTPTTIGVYTPKIIGYLNGVKCDSATLSWTIVYPAVTITDVRPDSIYVGENDTVDGTEFGATQGSSTFLIEGSEPTIVSWADTRIVFVMPSLAAGWMDIEVGDGYTTDADSVYCKGASQATQYTLTYNANGGTGSMSPVVYDSNATATAASNGFTRIGYNFTGWNTAANGSGTPRAVGATFTMSANVTLYAQWAIKTYTVTYNANGGSGTMTDASSPYDSNATVTVLSNSFTRLGFTFVSFNTAANGSGTTRAPGSTFAASANVILYAQWTIKNYDIDTTWAGTGSGTWTITEGLSNIDSNTMVHMTATPAAYNKWGGYSGDRTVSGTIDSFRIAANMSITGTFNPYPTYTIDTVIHCTATGCGTVTISPTDLTVDSATACTTWAVPATMDRCDSIVSVGSVSGRSVTTADSVIHIANQNWIDSVFFDTIPAVQYTLTMTNDGHGSTTPTGASQVNAGAATNIEATPAVGYNFVNWTVTAGTAEIALSTDPTTTVTLNDGAATVRANFSIKTYTITGTDVGNGTHGFIPANDSVADSLGTVRVYADADAGNVFSGFSGDTAGGVRVGDTLTVTMSADRAITLTFEPDTVQLTVTIVGTGTVTELPAGKSGLYQYGELCSLVAVYAPPDTFVTWSGASPAHADTVIFVMDRDRSIVATFSDLLPTSGTRRRGWGGFSPAFNRGWR